MTEHRQGPAGATATGRERPVVAVVDAPGGGYVVSPDIERRVLGEHAEVRLVVVPDEERDQLPHLDADFVILWHRVPLGAAFFERTKTCRAVVCASVGHDHVDLEAARAAGVAVHHVPHYGTEEVADHTLALFLSLARRLPVLERHVRDGGWDWRSIGDPRRLRGLTWGVSGLGRIGVAVAQRARAFGMDVLFLDPHNHPGIEKSLGLERVHRLEELIRRSDVVSLHVPLDGETRHLIGERELRWFRRGSVLLNTARGAVVDVAALRGALDEERPAWAGLDVVEGEPRVPGWLREHPRALLTPHAAFYSVESLSELRARAAEAALQLARSEQVTSAFPVTGPLRDEGSR